MEKKILSCSTFSAERATMWDLPCVSFEGLSQWEQNVIIWFQRPTGKLEEEKYEFSTKCPKKQLCMWKGMLYIMVNTLTLPNQLAIRSGKL